ncbi:MAG TPA: hypothetical protein ENH40_04620 [Nitrospirae bacterium]|nr:hypothetical protein [Nitrospirota bacterium]
MIPEQIKNLVKSGHAAPSADNTQPWLFVWDGEALYIRYDAKRVQGTTFPPESQATFLAVGGVIENISQAASFADIALDINIPDTISTDLSEPYVKISFLDTQESNTDIHQHPLFQRHTNRFKYRKTPLPSDIKHTLTTMTEGNAHIKIFEQKTSIKKIASVALAASKVRFQTQEVHEWLAKSLRFTDHSVKKADGLDVRTLDLPPGGRQFLHFISDWNRIQPLNKLGIYNLLALIDSRPLRQAPAIVSIISSTDPRSSLNAGRLLARAWTHLNSLGIAVHPYYVVSDQLNRLNKNLVPEKLTGQVENLKYQCENLFNLEAGEALHMLLRIGYPTRTPPRSLRLPFERVFTDLTND